MSGHPPPLANMFTLAATNKTPQLTLHHSQSNPTQSEELSTTINFTAMMSILNKLRDDSSTYGGVSFEASPLAYAEEFFFNFSDDDDDDDDNGYIRHQDEDDEEHEISNIYDDLNEANRRIEKRLLAKHIESGLINKVLVSNETPKVEFSPLRSAYSFRKKNGSIIHNETMSCVPTISSDDSPAALAETTSTSNPMADPNRTPASTGPIATITNNRRQQHRLGDSCPLVEVQDLLRSSSNFADDLQLLHASPATATNTIPMRATNSNSSNICKQQPAVAA